LEAIVLNNQSLGRFMALFVFAVAGAYLALAAWFWFAPGKPAIGRVAPEIVGKDLDGAPIKLSDFRGKVVMLDFWGDW
jgi:hypothetical protein